MRFPVACAALGLACLSTGALAQNAPSPITRPSAGPVKPLSPSRVAAEDEVLRGDTVMGRPRPDFDPLGIREGGFLFYPSLSVQESYESNIFATPHNEKGDAITEVAPTLDLKSDWDQHALNFHADSRSLIYADHDSESINDYTAGTDGRLDIRRDARVFGGAAYLVRHEPRSSPNDLGGKSPTEYSDYQGSIAGEKEFNRLSFRFDGNYDRYEYQNQATGAGTILQEERRNYDSKRVALRTGYEFQPLRTVYLLTGYNWRSYDFGTDISGFDRNSTGYEIALGAKYDLTGILFADVFAGYREQDYNDSRLKPVAGPALGGKLTWNVTRLTTVTGSLSREIEEIDLANSSGYFATRAGVKVDHELRRYLILNGSLSYERDDFEGISRNDNYYLAGIGATYLVNRYLNVSAGYSFNDRESNQSGVRFDDHLFLVRVTGHI